MTSDLSILMQPNKVTLFQTGINQDYFKLISSFLSINSRSRGIYVSSNRSAKDVAERIEEYNSELGHKLKAGEICIVDLVSRSVGAAEIEGAVYVSSPSELSATQMAIEGAINRTNSEFRNTWLIIDSLPTLLIFNSAGALLNFLHFLIGRLRVIGYAGILFAVEGSLTPRVFSTIAQLCDKVIK